MSRFEGSHTTTVTVTKPISAAIAHFADPETIVGHSENVASANVEGDTVHFVLTEQDHGITKFEGRYSCRYTADGNIVKWQTVGEGNFVQSGQATFTELDGGKTEIAYTEDLGIDLDVPAMMAPMLKPVISQVLAHEAKGFLGRMIKTLEA